jgi:hypothetical protein
MGKQQKRNLTNGATKRFGATSSKRFSTRERKIAAECLEAQGNLLEAEAPPEWFHSGQRELWEATERTLIALCGTQGGKTAMLPWWLLRETQRCVNFLLDNPLGRNAIFAGPSLGLLRAQAIPALKRVWIDELNLARWVETPKPRLVLTRKGALRLLGLPMKVTIHCAYTSDPNNLESMTADAAVWDEAGQVDNKETALEAIRRRLLVASSCGHGRLLIGTTPYEWNWLKYRLVDRSIDDAAIRIVNWPSWLNPTVNEAECKRELQAGMPEWRWRMMYLGQFERPAGLIYDCFDDKFNICPRFRVPEDWPLVVGVDFGPENTAAVVLARERVPTPDGGWGEETGRYYVIGTYHAGEKKTVGQHINAIREVVVRETDGAYRKPVGYGGSQGEVGWRESWSMAGLPLAKPSDGDVEYQIQLVWSGFRRRIAGGRHAGFGQLVVFDDLYPLLGEIGAYSREITPEGERTDKIANKSRFHRLDALRYVAPALLKLPANLPRVKVYRRGEMDRTVELMAPPRM